VLSLTNGWTGGQYGLYRFTVGLYLAVHFIGLLPWSAELFSNTGMLPDSRLSPLTRAFPNVLAAADSPLAVQTTLIVAIVASGLFAVGTRDRLAAVVVWYVWACLLGRNPLIRNPGIPFVGWLLLLHAFLPVAPYGSLDARRRPDPGGGWRMPPALFGSAWVVMAIAYSYSGVMKLASPSWLDGSAFVEILNNPLARPGPLREVALQMPPAILQAATWVALCLEIVFAPAALIRQLRPYLWGAMVAMHLGLLCIIDFADLTLGMLVIHAFTFDPAWVRRTGTVSEVLYDGGCALCHAFVRFVIVEGPADIRFAPIRKPGMVTIIVKLAEGKELTRSDAVIAVLRRCGGFWRVLGEALRLIPRPVRDLCYSGVASFRYRVFGHAADVCPVLPPEIRSRIER
jgi:predicted DCC family thiol-disulfide oxidoreductase YuxK